MTPAWYMINNYNIYLIYFSYKSDFFPLQIVTNYKRRGIYHIKSDHKTLITLYDHGNSYPGMLL